MYTVIHQKLLKTLATNDQVESIRVARGFEYGVDSAITFYSLFDGERGTKYLLQGDIKIGVSGDTYSVGIATEIRMVQGNIVAKQNTELFQLTLNHTQIITHMQDFINNSIANGFDTLKREGYIKVLPVYTKQKGFTTGLDKLAQNIGNIWSLILLEKKDHILITVQMNNTNISALLFEDGLHLLIDANEVGVFNPTPTITSISEIVDILPTVILSALVQNGRV